MVRPPFIDCNGMKKGAWSEEEDNKLRAYVLKYGHWNWRLLPKYAGLARCGKSCRLRWVNYLKPGVIRGNFTKEEEDLIIKLHSQLGNKWSAIATKLPGRTDNEIKNFYHTRIQKRPNEKPSPNKVKHHASSSEASSKEGETTLDNNTSPHVITPPQVDTLPDIFKIDTNHNQMESFPLLTDDEFDYVPQLHYSQLSTSNSSYMDPLDWIADDDRSNISYPFVDPSAQGCLWSEESSASNYQNGRPDDFCDPLFGQCFDYGGMGLFS